MANAYGMVQPGASDTSAVRATFVIDPQGILRAMIYYPMSNGRSIDEVLRLVKSLQTSDAHGVATPEAWQPGEPVIVPPPATDAEAEARQGQGYTTPTGTSARRHCKRRSGSGWPGPAWPPTLQGIGVLS